jgi:hypothetical protein
VERRFVAVIVPALDGAECFVESALLREQVRVRRVFIRTRKLVAPVVA